MTVGLDRRTLLLGAAVLLGCALARSATAAEPELPAVIAEIETLDQETLDKAETLFFQALAHYRQGRYAKAAVDFQKAFVLTNHRDLLFNIARSREKLGDTEGAVESYRNYLATRPADETAIIHRIRQLGGDPTPAPADLRDIADDVGIDSPLVVQSAVDPWPYVSLGAGLAAAGVGTWFGLDALNLATRARATDDRADAIEYRDGAEQSALIADVSFAVGVVAVGTAIVLWARSDEPASQGALRVGASPGGGYVGYTLDF